MAPAEVSDVVRVLQCRALVAAEVDRSPELLPAGAGFYAWWTRRGTLTAVPHIPHPLESGLGLLYVGISPARETSRQTLRSRVIGNHLNGNVGSSTFRFVLAALLIDALELRPFLRGTKVALNFADNAQLSKWQHKHLLLTWCARERPWQIEREVIAQLAPPLNSAGNDAHAFHPSVRSARAEFRRRAREAVAMPKASRGAS
jgi:hypothetical protein